MLSSFSSGVFRRGQSTDARFQQLANAARAAQEAKDYRRAGDIYRQIVTLRPNDPIAYQSLGLALYLGGRYAEAVAPLETAIRLNPKLPGASLYLGISRFRLNEFEKAVEVLRKARSLDPANAAASYWLGASHLALKNYSAAIRRTRGGREARSQRPGSFVSAGEGIRGALGFPVGTVAEDCARIPCRPPAPR